MLLIAFDEPMTCFSVVRRFVLMMFRAFDEPVTCFSRTGVRVNVVDSI